jgi:hypothetical protein
VIPMPTILITDEDRTRRFQRFVWAKVGYWNQIHMCSEFGDRSIAAAREMAARDVNEELSHRSLTELPKIVVDLRQRYETTANLYDREMRSMIHGSQAWRDYPECVAAYEEWTRHARFYAFADVELWHLEREYRRYYAEASQ